jgi:hypothetical protein
MNHPETREDGVEASRETERRETSPRKQLKGEDHLHKSLKVALNKNYKPVKPKVF